MAKHNPLPISERPKSFGVCSTHQDTKMELYCQECNIPLCVYCKINGHHSQGDNNGHKLVKITDAYSKALRDSKDYDPLLEKRKNHLAECLSKIDNKIKEINKNAASLEEQIYKKLQEVLLDLQKQTQKKMSFLIGDQLELKRQYDHIQWLESYFNRFLQYYNTPYLLSFLKYQQDVLNPADYLNAWSRHNAFVKEIIQTSQIPNLINVEPDMLLDSDIRITTVAQKNMGAQLTGSNKVQGMQQSVLQNNTNAANWSGSGTGPASIGGTGSASKNPLQVPGLLKN